MREPVAQSKPLLKFLCFLLAGEEYALPILKVREILGRMEVTPLPGSGDHLKGVINLRGRLIPVIDLRKRFHIEEPGQGDCIITVQARVQNGQELFVGLWVDMVTEVSQWEEGEIGELPQLQAARQEPCLNGLAKKGERVCIVLDPEPLLEGEMLSLAARS
jgi:purine-binding chemotaxis protein CheW